MVNPSIFSKPWQVISANFYYTVSYFSQQLANFIPHKEQDIFFVRMQTNPLFRRYENWRATLNTAIDTIFDEMKEGKLTVENINRHLETFFDDENNIISPAYYHHAFKKLNRKINRELNQSVTYTDNVKKDLKKDLASALQYFYQDILVNLVQLSGNQIKAEKFLQRINYYEEIIPSDIYQATISRLQAFLQQHYIAESPLDLYLEHAVSAEHFEKLIIEIKARLQLPAEEIAEIDQEEIAEKKANKSERSWLKASFDYAKANPDVVATSVLAWQGIIGGVFALFPACAAQYNLNVTSFNISTLNGTNGFASNSGNFFASGYCDFNGDGLRDLYAAGSGVVSGVVIFGGAKFFPAYLDVTTINSNTGVIFQNVPSSSAITCLDFDGDGFDDVAIGSGGSGQVFIVRGTNLPITSPISVTADTNGTTTFGINGIGSSNNDNGEFGSTLAACDVNQDGFDDLIISSPLAPVTSSVSGVVYTFLGQQESFGSFVNMTTLLATGKAFALNNTDYTATFGRALACGDINNDSYADIIIASQVLNVYAYYGHSGSFFSSVITAIADGIHGFVIQVGDGDSVALGDINGDGIKDIVIGTSFASTVSVISGSNRLPSVISPSYLNGTAGFYLLSGAGDHFGDCVASCDINRDGLDDILATAPLALSNAGNVRITYSVSNFPPSSFINETTGVDIPGTLSYQYLGELLSCGDINGDQQADIFVGASGGGHSNYNIFSVLTSISPSPSPGASPSNSPSSSPTRTPSISPTRTPSTSISASVTPTSTRTPSPTPSISLSPSVTPSVTPSITVSPSTTPLPSVTPSASSSSTSSITPSSSVTPSVSLSAIVSSTPTGTITPSVSTQATSSQHAHKISINHSGRNNTVIVGSVLGGIIAAALIALGTFFGYRKFTQRRRDDKNDLIEQIEMQPQSSSNSGSSNYNAIAKLPRPSSTEMISNDLSPDREEKGYAVIGGIYQLINKINTAEAKALKKQTGISIVFPEGEMKVKVKLGQGQFGKLRLARDRNTNEFVGVKKIKGDLELQKSRAEAKLQKELTDLAIESGQALEGIMPLLLARETTSSIKQPALYIFLPLAGYGNGLLLQSYLAATQSKLFQEKMAVHVARYLLTGAAYMHEHHIYHLDIKNTNYVLDKQGKVYLIDFGCAIKNDKSSLLQGGDGDSRYYSPDRLDYLRKEEHQHNVTYDGAKADSWAIGLTLLELLINNYPFDSCHYADRKAYWNNDYFTTKIQDIVALQQPNADSIFSLIKQLLAVDPKQRLTPQQALEHPIFQKAEYKFESENEIEVLLDSFKILMNKQSLTDKLLPEPREKNYAPTQYAFKNKNYNNQNEEKKSFYNSENNVNTDPDKNYAPSQYAFKNTQRNNNNNNTIPSVGTDRNTMFGKTNANIEVKNNNNNNYQNIKARDNETSEFDMTYKA